MAQWNPWQEMEALRREIDRAFERVGGQLPPLFRTAFLPGHAAREYPLVNLHEDQDSLCVEALAPGLDPASVNGSCTCSLRVIDRNLSGDTHRA